MRVLVFIGNGSNPTFTDLDLSNLTNMTNLDFINMGLSGTLTFPSSHVSGNFGGLRFYGNPNLTSVANLDSYTDPIGNGYFDYHNTGLDIDFTIFTNRLYRVYGSQSAQTVVDFSNTNEYSVNQINTANDTLFADPACDPPTYVVDLCISHFIH